MWGRRFRLPTGSSAIIEKMIDALWHDTRYALRLVRLSPAFAFVAIVSIALGAGANTAIFQLLDAISLRSLPVQSPQELVELRIDDMTHARGSWLRDNALSNPLWEQIRARQQVFQGMFAWADEPWNISANGEFRPVAGLWVSERRTVSGAAQLEILEEVKWKPWALDLHARRQ